MGSHERDPSWPPFAPAHSGLRNEVPGDSLARSGINGGSGHWRGADVENRMSHSTAADVILQTASRMVRSTGSAISMLDHELHFVSALSSTGSSACAAVEVTRSLTAREARLLFSTIAPGETPIRAAVSVPSMPCETMIGRTGSYDVLLLKLFTSRENRWLLCLIRDPSDQGFAEHEINALNNLLPMFEWLLRREVDSVLAETGAPGWQILNELRVGVVLAGADGHVAASNRRAMVLLKSNDSLTLINGRIGLRRPAENAQFQRALREISSNGIAGGRSMLVEQENDRGALLIRLVRLADSVKLCGVRSPSVAVFLSDTTVTDKPDPAPLQQLFGLSRIEADVVSLLCAGYCPKEAAARLGITPNTVRSYLKSIFRKMGVHRQADLIRVIAASP